MTIKDNQDFTEKAISRLPNQFVDSENLINLVSLNSDRMQGINDEAIKMLDGMSISTASGKQLDNIATILNLIRIVGESDSDFRSRIISETAVLSKSGEPSHVIDVYLLLTEASSVFFNENYPAGIELAAHTKEYENLILYSEQFDNAAWSDPLGEWSVVADIIPAPDGSITADEITVDAGDTLSLIRQSQLPVFLGETYTFSAWIKFLTGTITDFRIDVGDGVSNSIFSQISSNWARVEATIVAGILAHVDLQVTFSGASATFAIFGAQLESGLDLGDYNKTTNLPALVTDKDDAIIRSMQNVKAGGINMILLISPETDFFFFDSSANVDGSGNGTIDASGGFGSSLDLDGGQLSRVLA